MPHEVPVDEGLSHGFVSVCEGVDLDEPVVEPRRHQQRVVDVGLARVLVVSGQQVVEFGVHVFGRAGLVQDTVRSRWVVQQRLEDIGMEADVEPLAELDCGGAALPHWSEYAKGSFPNHIAKHFSLC